MLTELLIASAIANSFTSKKKHQSKPSHTHKSRNDSAERYNRELAQKKKEAMKDWQKEMTNAVYH